MSLINNYIYVLWMQTYLWYLWNKMHEWCEYFQACTVTLPSIQNEYYWFVILFTDSILIWDNVHLIYWMVLDNVNLVLKSFRLARMVACFHCFSLILMMPSALPIMKGGTQEVKCRIYLRETLGWLDGLFSFRYWTKVGWEQLKHMKIPKQA